MLYYGHFAVDYFAKSEALEWNLLYLAVNFEHKDPTVGWYATSEQLKFINKALEL